MKVLPRSIGLRLTMALGAIALVVFTVAGVLLYRALVQELQRAAHDELLGKIEVVKHFVEEARVTRDLVGLRHHLDDLLIGHRDLRVWLEAADGSAVYGGQPPKVIGTLNQPGHLRVLRRDGVVMDALDATLANTEPLAVVRARVATETRPRDQLLASYRIALLAVGVFGVLLTVVLSALATWRGLAPVKRLSAEATNITPHSMAIRLSDTHVDDEVSGLVDAFNGVLDRLEGAYQQMEAFNADVAHELRTPLATLINGTQIMLSAERSNHELRDTLGSNLEELDQLNAIVNNMLFLARADQGDRAQDIEEIDLGTEADKTIQYSQALLEDAGLRAVREGSVKAHCNIALVRRALVNLLSNAIKNTERGRTITVSVETGPGAARLSVLNPGEPISGDDAARMFDRFFRADEARARSGESHGLGLAIVRAIARMHGGSVFVESGAAGNRVGFEFPRTQRSITEHD